MIRLEYPRQIITFPVLSRLLWLVVVVVVVVGGDGRGGAGGCRGRGSGG